MNLPHSPLEHFPMVIFVIFILAGILCIYVSMKILRKKFVYNLKWADAEVAIMIPAFLILDIVKYRSLFITGDWWYVYISFEWFEITSAATLLYIIWLIIDKPLEKFSKRVASKIKSWTRKSESD